MTGHGQIPLLQAARARILAGLPVDPVAVPAVSSVLASVIQRRSRQEEIALRQAGLRERNRRLREADAVLLPLPSLDARARRLLELIAHYEATAWRRHRGLISCPEELDSKPEHHLWHALKSFHRIPRSINAIAMILKNEDPQ